MQMILLRLYLRPLHWVTGMARGVNGTCARLHCAVRCSDAKRCCTECDRAIADHLHDARGVSYWWAQTITVEYEQHIGRRVPGQTQDGYFQLGASRTFDEPAASLWSTLDSPAGLRLVLAEREVYLNRWKTALDRIPEELVTKRAVE